MTLSSLVVSRELALELKEAGYPQETVFYWDIAPGDSHYPDGSKEKVGWSGDFSAPTATELLDVLPGEIYVKESKGGLKVVNMRPIWKKLQEGYYGQSYKWSPYTIDNRNFDDIFWLRIKKVEPDVPYGGYFKEKYEISKGQSFYEVSYETNDSTLIDDDGFGTSGYTIDNTDTVCKFDSESLANALAKMFLYLKNNNLLSK